MMPSRKRYRKAKKIKVPCPRPDKKSYTSRDAATEAKMITEEYRQVTLSVYQCQCEMWHLGSDQSLLAYKIQKAFSD